MKKLNKVFCFYYIFGFIFLASFNNVFANDLDNSKWILDSSRSYLDFSSVKNNTIIEVHKFTELSGDINQDGLVNIKIDLKSVATGLDIRDQRLKEFLFETKKYPTASFTAKIDLKKILTDLKINSIYKTNLDGYLILKDHRVFTKLNVEAKYINPTTVKIMSVNPVVLNIADFQMQKGIEKLRELANLDSIGFTVPVNFKVVFKKED